MSTEEQAAHRPDPSHGEATGTGGATTPGEGRGHAAPQAGSPAAESPGTGSPDTESPGTESPGTGWPENGAAEPGSVETGARATAAGETGARESGGRGRDDAGGDPLGSIARVLEAALLVAGRPLAITDLEKLFGDGEAPPRATLREALARLDAEWQGRCLQLQEVASGYRAQVRNEYEPWIARLWDEKPPRYSRALLETLAIIAYRQPMTRSEIEDIRGVSVSSQIIRTLTEREWIRVVGHRETPGRPALYGTTREFLDYFNLKTLDQLPPISDIRDLEGSDPELGFEAEPEVSGDTAGASGDRAGNPERGGSAVPPGGDDAASHGGTDGPAEPGTEGPAEATAPPAHAGGPASVGRAAANTGGTMPDKAGAEPGARRQGDGAADAGPAGDDGDEEEPPCTPVS